LIRLFIQELFKIVKNILHNFIQLETKPNMKQTFFSNKKIKVWTLKAMLISIFMVYEN
jgi:hypothetical protein